MILLENVIGYRRGAGRRGRVCPAAGARERRGKKTRGPFVVAFSSANVLYPGSEAVAWPGGITAAAGSV